MMNATCESCGGGQKVFVVTVRGTRRTYDRFTCAVRALAEHVPEGAPITLERPLVRTVPARRRTGDHSRGASLPALLD
jgi:hypothetical protein